VRGIGNLKHEIGLRALPAVERLPYREPLLEYLRAERASGSRIVLATAANAAVAHAVARHLGLFDDVIASSATRNLKGAEKARALRERIGSAFIYAGDSAADLLVWRHAGEAILVNTSEAISARVRASMPVAREFKRETTPMSDWVRAMRVHQWLKNVLIFVPLLTAFSFGDVAKLFASLAAFVAFSLVASATYIGNDLLDLDTDRGHPRKRNRPFAAGRLTVASGLLAAAALLSAGLALAAATGVQFLVATLAYLVLTLSYSWKLKQVVLLDALTLAFLYTIRIVAGSAAISVQATAWLLAFSMFVFFSLALVKRCSELVALRDIGRIEARGRNYLVADLALLWPLGVGASLSAVVVFGLFINSPETQHRYHTPSLLWLTAAGLLYWLSHVWLMTGRARMHDDPLVFAARDSRSRFALGFIVLSTLAARYLALAIA
jgi:4-hydroxybenzoate polyprenyltransferase